MPVKFEPGQKVLIRKDDDCIKGMVISSDNEYTVVQFEDLNHPTVLDEVALKDLELCEDDDNEETDPNL
ncbi:MAG: hypothetical protein WKF97_23800 [Chitinophagaceae bacterium]